MSIKIPIFTASSLGFERDMIAFSFSYKSFPVTISKAIVDNGCPFTIISESSLKRTRIPYNQMNTSQMVQLGNIPLQLKHMGVCSLKFRNINNKTQIFNHEVYAGIPAIKGYLAQELPSFIGKDFFDVHNLSLLNTKDGKFIFREED